MAGDDTDPGGLAWFFRKASELKDALVLSTVGMVGFAIGEVAVDLLAFLPCWVLSGFSCKKARKLCNGYCPGNLIGSGWEAVKKAWKEFFGSH